MHEELQKLKDHFLDMPTEETEWVELVNQYIVDTKRVLLSDWPEMHS